MMTKQEKEMWAMKAVLAESDAILLDLLLQMAILEMETGVDTDAI